MSIIKKSTIKKNANKNCANKNCTNNGNANSSIYYANGAILFTRIFGTYKVANEILNFASGTMVLGETYTFDLPPGASDLTVNIETSAYFSWTNCYSETFRIIPANLCFYSLGYITMAECFDASCTDRTLEALICKYLSENPIEYTNNHNNKNMHKCCHNNIKKYNNSNNIPKPCYNRKNNDNSENKCNLCSSELGKAYMQQVTNYVRIMKDYLPEYIVSCFEPDNCGV